MRGKLGIAAVLAALAVAAALPAAAQEAEQTRQGFVQAAERICQRDTARSKRILRGAQKRINREMRPAAGRQFTRAAAAYGASLTQIMRIPLPPADEARLRLWFKYLRVVHTRMKILARKLKADQKFASNYAAINVERAANTANNVGFPFGFKHCRFTRARFG